MLGIGKNLPSLKSMR